MATVAKPRFIRRWRRGLIVGGVGWALVWIMSIAGCTDRLLLFPTTARIDAPGVSHDAATTPAGKTIDICIARSVGAQGLQPQAYVLAFNGNASRAEYFAQSVAQDWAERPVEVWAVNYPGYGASTGAPRLRSIPHVALVAYDKLKARSNGRPIFVQGQSIGCTAALYVAANRPVAGVCLSNPPPLRDLILRRHGWWNLWLLAGPVALSIPNELDTRATAARCLMPAVITSAGSDTVVPPKYQDRVIAAYAGPKQVVRAAGLDHNDSLDGTAWAQYQAALAWMWDGVIKTAPAP